MNKLKMLLMCGLPCSGKSTMAKSLAKEYNATVFSSDELRFEMFGDINDQSHNQELFVELYRRIKECLKSGKSAVFDATNISYKRRMAFLTELKKIPCEKICVLMATPYEECLKRNAERERKVPEGVIKRMYMHFNVPYFYEGWNDVQVVYSDRAEGSYGYPVHWLNTVKGYDQGNSHHTLTLGEHCRKAWKYISSLKEQSVELRVAAILHDEGKEFTRTNINSHGVFTEETHYYNHQFVSSYDSLFYGGAQDKLYTAQLIQWHMTPYMAWKQSEKARERDRKMLGERLYNDIILLHEADKKAH